MKSSSCPQNFYLFFMMTTIWLVASMDTAQGVMPPELYAAQAKASKIKAIASVQSIEILSKNRHHTRKRVVFILVRPFEKGIPESFSGVCYSVEPSGQEPLPGGTLYYYPVVGQKVLVTILENGRQMTSYTPLYPDLENEIKRKALTNIVFKMGTAEIVKEAQR